MMIVLSVKDNKAARAPFVFDSPYAGVIHAIWVIFMMPGKMVTARGAAVV